MRKKFRNSVIAAVACAPWLAACHGAAIPSQVLTKPSPAAAAPAAPRTGGPWPYRASSSRQSFVVDQRAVVSIQSDTATRTDTIETHAEVAFTIAPPGNVVAGDVAALLVGGGGRAASTPTGLATPFPFRAEYQPRNGGLDFTTPRDATPCGSLALAAAQSLRDLWLAPPDTLRVGSQWQDSASYAICRDGVPLRATTHRTFRVTAATTSSGRALLTITRTSRLTLDGAGAQFGEAITVSGSGFGELRYVFDPTGGAVVSANGTSTLDFTLRSRLRTQAVRQAAEVRIGRS